MRTALAARLAAARSLKLSYKDLVLADAPLGFWRLGDATGFTITATASSSFGNEPPSNAFDGNSGTPWTADLSVNTGWLRAQLSTPQRLTAYGIRRRDDLPGRNPSAWTFEGSSDGSSWTVLDTRSGVTWPTAGESKRFGFANTQTYAYYRINVTANAGDPYLSIAELDLRIAGDSSGNARDGLYSGGVSPTVGLVAGDGGAVFGSNGYCAIPSGAWANVSQITAEALVLIPAGNGSPRDIVTRDDGGFVARHWNLRLNTDHTLQLLLWTGAGLSSITTSTVLTTGQIYHVAFTYDGSVARVYVNGAQVTSATINSPIGTSSIDLSIGATVGGNYERFAGTIDEVAVYGAALPAARLAAHYAGIAA